MTTRNKRCKSMAVAACAALCALSASAKELKVLVIGNSFSHCVLEEWPQCAASAGDTLDVASLFIGGCSLSRHWENVEKSSDPDFKPYICATVKARPGTPVSRIGSMTNIPQALVADKWDVVTIQQVSTSSPFPESYEPFAGKLIAKIRELAPQAEIVVQETWSYAPYDRRLKMTPAEMHAAIKKAYAQLAERYKLRTIPTGDAVQFYRQRLPVDYGKLLAKEEIAAIREPTLMDFHGDVVGSSRWGKGNAWNEDKDVYRLRLDSIHLNKEGNYLQALVWQAALFGSDVEKLTYRPAYVTAEKAELMRTCAMDAVKAYQKEKAVGFAALGNDEKCPISENVRGHENIEWSTSYAYGLTDETCGLPRVLLVGDSICNGYQCGVRERLKGKMNVTYWVSSYCVTSPAYLRLLSIYLDEAKYDVIHFNNGHHTPSKTPVEAYSKGLEAAFELIRRKQPQAKLVWCSTTPLKSAAMTARCRERNEAAAKVAARLGGIAIDDLFALCDPLDRKSNWKDNYHFLPAAITMQAEQVSASVLAAAGLVATTPIVESERKEEVK